MYKNNPLRSMTGVCRLSYEHLMKEYANQPGAEAKYSATLLIPKTDVNTKADIDSSIQAAIQKGISEKWGGTQPPNLKIPLHDGDGLRQSGEPFGPECKGHWVMTASSKLKPQVVDQNGNDIIIASEVYSGMYARVTLNFFPYNSNGNRGIGCGLGNVQKLADGEPLGGRTTAADDFGDTPLPEHFAGTAQAATQSAAAAHAQPPVYSAQAAQQTTSQAPFAAPFTAQQQVNPFTGQQQTVPQQQVNPFASQQQSGGIMGI